MALPLSLASLPDELVLEVFGNIYKFENDVMCETIDESQLFGPEVSGNPRLMAIATEMFYGANTFAIGCESGGFDIVKPIEWREATEDSPEPEQKEPGFATIRPDTIHYPPRERWDLVRRISITANINTRRYRRDTKNEDEDMYGMPYYRCDPYYTQLDFLVRVARETRNFPALENIDIYLTSDEGGCHEKEGLRHEVTAVLAADALKFNAKTVRLIVSHDTARGDIWIWCAEMLADAFGQRVGIVGGETKTRLSDETLPCRHIYVFRFSGEEPEVSVSEKPENIRASARGWEMKRAD